MKLFPIHVRLGLLPLAALAALTAPRAQAQALPAELQRLSSSQLEAKLDKEVRDTIADASSSHPVADHLLRIQWMLQEQGQRLADQAGECTIQGRLMAEIQELQVRARRFVLRADEVMQLEVEIVLARLERAVVPMQSVAWTRDGFHAAYDRAIAVLQERADVFVDGLGSPSVAQRLQGAIEAVAAKAQAALDATAELHEVWRVLVDARRDRALSWLADHEARRQASPRDYQRLVEIDAARARLAIASWPYACGS